MDPADIELVRVSQQIALASMQASVAFSQAQERLDLANVLAADRLVTAPGMAQSRQTLAELGALTAQHKAMFARQMTSAAAQLLAATEQVTEDRRTELVQGLKASINWNLAAQAKFYEGRERWMAAVAQALDLAEQHSGEFWLEDGQLVVATDALLEELQLLAAEMDKVSEEEAALLQQRQGRLAATAARLGPRP